MLCSSSEDGRVNHDPRRPVVTMRAKAKIILDTRHHGATKQRYQMFAQRYFVIEKNKANHLLFVRNTLFGNSGFLLKTFPTDIQSAFY